MPKDTSAPGTASQGAGSDPPINPPPSTGTVATDAPAKLATTPEEHARETGNLVPEKRPPFAMGGRPKPADVYTWQHRAAVQLHGWDLHAHHTAKPIELTREAYLAALKAAGETATFLVGTDGKRTGSPLSEADVQKLNGTKPVITDYVPHLAALSKHAPDADLYLPKKEA